MAQRDSPSGTVRIPARSVLLPGTLTLPSPCQGLVLFAHGTGSSRLSPRNQFVAGELCKAGIGTLLFDLLTPEEDQTYENRFDIDRLTERLGEATLWVQGEGRTRSLPFGYFGASTGAASALRCAARFPETRAVVSRGGRPDLAMEALPKVEAPTLLIVGGHDDVVIELNQQAYAALTRARERKIEIVEGATHLFEEEGALEEVARLAKEWFLKFLSL